MRGYIRKVLSYAHSDLVRGDARSRMRFLLRALTFLPRNVMRLADFARWWVWPGTPIRAHKVQIAVLADGGLGDLISTSGYLERLYVESGFPDIDVFHARPELSEFLLARARYVRDALPAARLQRLRGRYDVVVRIERTVRFDILKPERVERLSSVLAERTRESTRRNAEHFAQYMREAPYRDGELARAALAMGLDRKALLGYSGATSFTSGDWVCVAPDIAGLSVFARHGLTPGRYITLHDGFDTSFAGASVRSTKQWPLAAWNALVEQLRQELPGTKLVQVGGAHSVPFAGVDVCLVGSAELNEVAWLVKYAACHVDNESGIARLTREMGGRAVVLFGPTDVDFFGLAEHVNLRPRQCGNCFWSTSSWLTDCPRGMQEPVCMSATPVADVLEAIRRVVEGRPEGGWELTSARLFEGETLRRDAALLAQILQSAGIAPVPTTQATARPDQALYIDPCKQWEYLFAVEQIRAATGEAHGPLRIADLGSGRGGLSHFLAHTGTEVSAFDMHYPWNADGDADVGERFFRLGKDAGVEVRYGSLFNLPASDASFDVVTCISALEHVPSQGFALREAWRVLKPGGVLIVTFVFAAEVAPFESGARVQVLTPSRMEALLAEAGITRADPLFTADDVESSAAVVHGMGVGGRPAGVTVGGMVLRKVAGMRAPRAVPAERHATP